MLELRQLFYLWGTMFVSTKPDSLKTIDQTELFSKYTQLQTVSNFRVCAVVLKTGVLNCWWTLPYVENGVEFTGLDERINIIVYKPTFKISTTGVVWIY